MHKKKKSSKNKSTSQKNNQFARNLNIFIALAGFSYTVFLVFSKWSRIQESVSGPKIEKILSGNFNFEKMTLICYKHNPENITGLLTLKIAVKI